MASVTTDRRQGVSSSAAVKVPVQAATTANITLSGEQTIDGIAVVTDDRVLVKDQTTGSENGIYDVNTSSWTRSPDWDGAFDVVQGTIIPIAQGTANAGKLIKVSTSGAITIGTTSIAFVDATTAAAGQFYATLSGEMVVTDNSYNYESLRRFGVKDGIDCTTQMQNAIDSGHPLYDDLGGTYTISSQLLYDNANTFYYQGLILIGAGQRRTIFKNDVAGNAMLKITNADSNSSFNHGGVISNFSIIQGDSAPATSAGIEYEGVRHTTFERLFFLNLTGDGIRHIASAEAKSLANMLTISNCSMHGLGGWGITNSQDAAVQPTSLHEYHRNYISGCAGGIQVQGYGIRLTQNSIDTCTTNPAIHCSYANSTHSYNVDLIGNWVEKNEAGGIWLEAVASGNLKNNHIIDNLATQATTYGIRMGGVAGRVCTGVTVEGTRFVHDAGVDPYTAIDLLATATGNNIKSTQFQTFTETGTVKKYANLGAGNEIIDEGNILLKKPLTDYVATISTSTTIELINGPYQRINVNTATFTFNAPNAYGTSVEGGDELILTVYNNTASAIAVTFNSIFIIKGYTDPAPSGETTARFVYDSGLVKWVQTGTWSGIYTVKTFTSTDATPSVKNGRIFKTAGTTAITDFDDGVVGQTIKIIADASITITDNAAIILSGGVNYNMTASDTLTLTMYDDQVWNEDSRSVN